MQHRMCELFCGCELPAVVLYKIFQDKIAILLILSAVKNIVSSNTTWSSQGCVCTYNKYVCSKPPSFFV